jgi:hypothetical protein
MMAEKPAPPELTPDQVAAELRSAGIALTSESLQKMIDAHRAEHEQRSEERERERRQNHPLIGLMPEHVDENTAYRAAIRGELVAEKCGGRWFSSIASVESWLRRTDKLTKEAEVRWRATMARRFE